MGIGWESLDICEVGSLRSNVTACQDGPLSAGWEDFGDDERRRKRGC